MKEIILTRTSKNPPEVKMHTWKSSYETARIKTEPAQLGLSLDFCTEPSETCFYEDAGGNVYQLILGLQKNSVPNRRGTPLIEKEELMPEKIAGKIVFDGTAYGRRRIDVQNENLSFLLEQRNDLLKVVGEKDG